MQVFPIWRKLLSKDIAFFSVSLFCNVTNEFSEWHYNHKS